MAELCMHHSSAHASEEDFSNEEVMTTVLKKRVHNKRRLSARGLLSKFVLSTVFSDF